MSGEERTRDPLAFKEWQVICDALESGEQCLVLRKGGIAEGKRGFEWRHNRFFLFPTRFHQQLDGVRGDRQLQPPCEDGHLEIRLWADTMRTAILTNWDRVAALAPHHIWTEDVVRERYEWGDSPGIHAAFLQVHRLREPWRLPNANRPAFSGCRSWIKLPSEEWNGSGTLADAIAAADPVLDDDEFGGRCAEMRTLLGG